MKVSVNKYDNTHMNVIVKNNKGFVHSYLRFFNTKTKVAISYVIEFKNGRNEIRLERGNPKMVKLHLPDCNLYNIHTGELIK